MDVFRAAYVVDEETEFGQRLRRFWDGTSGRDDPFRQLLEPEDLRGEVTAWGDAPHWTVLDAMTTCAPDEFADVIKSVCRLALPPTIRPKRLQIYGSSALVVECVEQGLSHLRAALVATTRHLIARSQLADEEFQRAEWWFRRIGKDAADQPNLVERARGHYVEAGSPPLPNSRHFRLGFLARLVKEMELAKDVAERELKSKHLQHFLAHGEPHWYVGSGSLHITVCSGLKVTDAVNRQRQLEKFTSLLWPTIEQGFRSYEPRYSAIMGEDPEATRPVHFFDWLTGTFVEEERPGFKELDCAAFGHVQGA